jgi:hypothetical protein
MAVSFIVMHSATRGTNIYIYNKNSVVLAHKQFETENTALKHSFTFHYSLLIL